ncbi:hypothetical protein PR048_014701 [Dryococelus australis]|uniref:Uncharacterized protein n=1 Tax=Dryococelus australis TaxID=614101 RepID=A0ABQ9HF40_9NEOP|nr:hypothetical protein PR048_014701 [Dryococelus australis]
MRIFLKNNSIIIPFVQILECEFPNIGVKKSALLRRVSFLFRTIWRLRAPDGIWLLRTSSLGSLLEKFLQCTYTDGERSILLGPSPPPGSEFHHYGRCSNKTPQNVLSPESSQWQAAECPAVTVTPLLGGGTNDCRCLRLLDCCEEDGRKAHIVRAEKSISASRSRFSVSTDGRIKQRIKFSSQMQNKVDKESCKLPPDVRRVVRNRINSECNFVAAELQYHKNCDARFSSKLDAFNKLYNFLDANDDFMKMTLKFIIESNNSYSDKHMREMPLAPRILTNHWYADRKQYPVEEKKSIVNATIAILQEKIRSQVFDFSTYPTSEEISKSRENHVGYLPTCLLSGLMKPVKDLACIQKVLSIVHCIIASLLSSITQTITLELWMNALGFSCNGGVQCVTPASAVQTSSRVAQSKNQPKATVVGKFGYIPIVTHDQRKNDGLKHLNTAQQKCIVTFDQVLFIKVMNLVSQADESDVLSTSPKCLGGSGMEEIWEEVFAKNAVVHMVNGRAYARALRIHSLSQAAIAHLILESCQKEEYLICCDIHTPREIYNYALAYTKLSRAIDALQPQIAKDDFGICIKCLVASVSKTLNSRDSVQPWVFRKTYYTNIALAQQDPVSSRLHRSCSRPPLSSGDEHVLMSPMIRALFLLQSRF